MHFLFHSRFAYSAIISRCSVAFIETVLHVLFLFSSIQIVIPHSIRFTNCKLYLILHFIRAFICAFFVHYNYSTVQKFEFTSKRPKTKVVEPKLFARYCTYSQDRPADTVTPLKNVFILLYCGIQFK